MLTEKETQTALNQAVDYCIENDILKEFLLKNRAEVLGMLLEEFDAEKYERTIRGEGREEGKKEGLKIGMRLSIEILQETNQTREDAKKKIAEKYSVSEDEAEQELLLYWKGN